MTTTVPEINEDLEATVRLIRAGSLTPEGDARLYLAALRRMRKLRARLRHRLLVRPQDLASQAPTEIEVRRARRGLADDVAWLEEVATGRVRRTTAQVAAILDSVAGHLLVLLRWRDRALPRSAVALA